MKELLFTLIIFCLIFSGCKKEEKSQPIQSVIVLNPVVDISYSQDTRELKFDINANPETMHSNLLFEYEYDVRCLQFYANSHYWHYSDFDGTTGQIDVSKINIDIYLENQYNIKPWGIGEHFKFDIKIKLTASSGSSSNSYYITKEFEITQE